MSQRMNYNAVSPAGMKALGAAHGYIRQSGLPSRLVDLVFLGVSQINGWRRRDIDYVNALGAHTVVNFQTHPKGRSSSAWNGLESAPAGNTSGRRTQQIM